MDQLSNTDEESTLDFSGKKSLTSFTGEKIRQILHHPNNSHEFLANEPHTIGVFGIRSNNEYMDTSL
jgi:hypothetical protein